MAFADEAAAEKNFRGVPPEVLEFSGGAGFDGCLLGNGSCAKAIVKKIAVVEDNPDNRLLVRVILESLYEVTEYETGFSALEGFQQAMPDLVLLDVSLPEMDGTEVLHRIRADARLRGLPVIALTAHAMATDREKYLAAGFDDYVSKPIVDENLLLDAISAKLSAKPSL